MDLYTIYIMWGTFVATHISRLHASVVAHMQDPYSEFHHVNTRTHRLLWSLRTVPAWVEFRDKYHDFTITGALGWDGPRFWAQDS